MARFESVTSTALKVGVSALVSLTVNATTPVVESVVPVLVVTPLSLITA